MTDTDPHYGPEHTVSDIAPQRPGLWRAVSLISVFAAVALCVLAVLGARSTSNVAAADRPAVEMESALVRLTAGAFPEGSQVAALGLSHQESRRPASGTEVRIDVPKSMPAVVALYNQKDALVGLTVVKAGQDREMVEIDAASTARALLTLAPGILRPDLTATIANVAVIEREDAFRKLVTALEANPVISESNPDVELALAQIADRVPVKEAPTDQGCDSVLDPSAFASVGTCIEPRADRAGITNEQDRWTLFYSEAGYWDRLCNAVGPTKGRFDETILTIDACGGEVLLVAPGPIPSLNVDGDLLRDRVRTATAFNLLGSYAGPFADLVGSSAGFTRTSPDLLGRNAKTIVGSIDYLLASDTDTAEAIDSLSQASTPVDRFRSTIATTRALISASDTTPLIPERVSGDANHVAILDFYERAADRMASGRTDWRWLADAAAVIAVGSER